PLQRSAPARVTFGVTGLGALIGEDGAERAARDRSVEIKVSPVPGHAAPEREPLPLPGVKDPIPWRESGAQHAPGAEHAPITGPGDLIARGVAFEGKIIWPPRVDVPVGEDLIVSTEFEWTLKVEIGNNAPGSVVASFKKGEQDLKLKETLGGIAISGS